MEAHGPLRLISIEDDRTYLVFLAAMLEFELPGLLEFESAQTFKAGLKRVSEGAFDLLLLDLSLPDGAGLDLVRRVQARSPIPIVVLSGTDDEELALEAVGLGAQEYLIKGRFDGPLLVRTVRHAIERSQLLIALEESQTREIHRRDEFLSHVSHELRTPLSAIQQFASLLSEGIVGSPSDDQRDGLDVVLRNARELRHLIDDLLDVTRADHGMLLVEPMRLALGPIVEQVLLDARQRAEDAGVEVSATVPDGLEVVADPTRIRQVVINLLDNALGCTPAGGSISVLVGPCPERDDHVRLTVSDTGCGLSPEDCERVFGRMVQVGGPRQRYARRGLGLGLHICRELVELQGGRIWIESEQGAWTVVNVSLPAWSPRRLLMPILGEGVDEPGEPLTAFRVAVGPPVGSPGRVLPRAVLAGIRTVLQRSARVGRDAVLPSVGGDESGRVMYVVIREAEERLPERARWLANRLRRQADVQASGASVHVEAVPLLPGVGEGVEADAARRLAAATLALEGLLACDIEGGALCVD